MTITREEARDMSEAHAQGMHDDLPREGCPDCEGRELSEYPAAEARWWVADIRRDDRVSTIKVWAANAAEARQKAEEHIHLSIKIKEAAGE